MTFRRILTASLLLFVAASLVTLVVKGLQADTPSGRPPAVTTGGASGEVRAV